MNKINDNALSLHQKSIIIDMLNPSKITREYLLSMKKSGITASNITLAGAKHGDVAHIRNTPSDVIDDLTRFNRFIKDNNDIAIPIRCSADIEKAKAEEKIGIINGFQNSLPIREDLSLVKIYYNLGVRIIQLTYNEKNLVGGGCGDTSNSRLSEFGKMVVKEMNDLGILIDLSHVGDNTSLDAINFSKKSVAFTHANARALCHNPRNKSDSLIKLISSKGGIIGLVPISMFVTKNETNVKLDSLMNHANYMKKLVGSNYMGFGTDFMEGWTVEEVNSLLEVFPWEKNKVVNYVNELNSVTKLPNLTTSLMKNGYDNNEIQKIMGLNFFDLFKKVCD